MTLSVAVRFPFGHLAVLNRELSLGIDQAVILATDSRITSIRGGRVFTDRGRKLFRIANDAGLVYSGDSFAAHAAIRELRRYFSRRAVYAAREATPQVARLLSAAYQRELRERGDKQRDPVRPLDTLVGVCHPGDGIPAIIYMSSRSSFRPYLISDANIAAVGSQGEAANFEAKLLQLDEEQWTRPEPPPFEPAHWQIIVIAALTLLLEREDVSSIVGGPIQTLLISKHGVFANEFGYLADGADPLRADSWKIATIRADQTEPFRRGKGRASAAVF